MSSAKCTVMALLNREFKLLMESKNKKSPNIDPWDTGLLTDTISEEETDIKTNCFRLDKYDLNEFWAKLRIP